MTEPTPPAGVPTGWDPANPMLAPTSYQCSTTPLHPPQVPIPITVVTFRTPSTTLTLFHNRQQLVDRIAQLQKALAEMDAPGLIVSTQPLEAMGANQRLTEDDLRRLLSGGA